MGNQALAGARARGAGQRPPPADSRPHGGIGLFNAGEISYRTVGTHCRVQAASLVRYLRKDDARRTAAADELAAEAHALGLF